ncbi:MAG: polysaccharide lyase [Oligoflexia bacterium]|nr:polysaccharide lyase [Oligoflexia bacterium]
MFFLILSVLMTTFTHAESDVPRVIRDFETKNFSGWKIHRLSTKHAARIIENPDSRRYGKFAAAVTLRYGETYGDSWKSELSDPYYAPYEKEIWYRISHFLPGGFIPEKGNACTIAQWHNAAMPGVPGGGPPLAHEVTDGRLKVFVSYSIKPFRTGKDVINKTLFKIPFRRGQWHDFVYRIVWSKKGKGEIDAWHNGKYLGSYRGYLGYPNDAAGPYFKTGVYCKQSPRKPLTAYVDEYRRGPTADSVLLRNERLEHIHY